MKQTDCPYEVHVRYQRRQYIWKASEGTIGHPEVIFDNHKLSKYASAHFSNRRPTQAEKEEILRLDRAGIKAARITTFLKQNQEGCGGSSANIITSPRDIATIVTTNRKETKNGLAIAESAIELLQKLSWWFTFLEAKDSYLTDILFMPAKHEHLQLRARFTSVLLMDCTYSTNKAKLPFLHIVACTNKNTTFPVVF